MDDVLVLVVFLHGRHFLLDLEQTITELIRVRVSARESKRGIEGALHSDAETALFDDDMEGDGYDAVSEIATGVFVEVFNDVI
jgi:hypothetical protein